MLIESGLLERSRYPKRAGDDAIDPGCGAAGIEEIPGERFAAVRAGLERAFELRSRNVPL